MNADQASRECGPSLVLAAALASAHTGVPVFPVNRADKSPLTKNGFKDATCDETQIRAWWAKHPDANVAIPTGAASGVVVLDIDRDKGGFESLDALVAEFGVLPETPRARSGGGGAHYYFAHPGQKVGNRAGLRPGVDVRGDGGYIVVAPSIHASGGKYAWAKGAALGEIELAPMPAFMLAMEPKPAPGPQAGAKPSTDEHLRRRAELYVDRVPGEPEGGRNPAAFKLAGHLRAMVDDHGLGLDESVIFDLLLGWNARCSPPLPERELQKCLRSAATNGTPPPPKPPKGGPAGTSGGFGGSAPGASEYEWPDPQPLIVSLPPVMPFDEALLPVSFRAWIRDIADRVQCPIDFLAATLVVALATVVGRLVAIRPKRHDDWTVVANLWGGVIGRPSILKTPAVQEVMKPIRRLELEGRRQYKTELQEHEVACVVAEARRSQAKKDLREALQKGEDTAELARVASASAPEAPVRKRLVLNDATVEKLGEILNQNPNGVLQSRDELVGFLRSLDKEGQEPARAFYLEAWDGRGSFVYDRIGRGTLDIDSVTVSVFGCIQPGPLRHYLRGAMTGGADDDGFVQRFQILVWPDMSRTWKNVDRWPDTEAKREAHAIFQRVSEITAESVGAEFDKSDDAGIPFLRFSDEGQVEFDSWREALELRLRADEEHAAFENHLGKYRSLLPSIALLLHLADGKKGPVGVEYVRMAKAWCEYLESHARRVYSLVTHADGASAKALTKKILSRELKPSFTLKEVYKNGWAGLSNRDMVKSAVEILMDLDWLAEKVEKGAMGAPKTSYVVNPKVYALETPTGGTSKTSTSDGDWGEI